MLPTIATCSCFFFPLKGYLKEQLFSMNGSEEKPLPIQSLKTTLRSVEDQPSAFNPSMCTKCSVKACLIRYVEIK